MPWFGSSSPFDQDVEKATAENNIAEDWTRIMDICDKVGSTANGPKDCLRAVVKRIHHIVPHVSLQALVLLDACVNNCGKVFHLEVCSRDFEGEIRKIITGKQTHVKVAEKMKQLIKKWAENEFKNDPQLSLIPSLYQKLRSEGVDFSAPETPKKTTPLCKDPTLVTQQEVDDIAKAIELSLKEKQQSPKFSGLYPVAKPPSPGPSPKEKGKVRALYDFEAAEDNELTFKAGEIIHISDDSDPNWWKGSNQRGEGLFPANFVTTDLSVEPEEQKNAERKSVQFNENVQVKTVHVEPKDVEIDEEKIDKLLQLLHEADPSGERPDSAEMTSLEDQCAAMGPLIDEELEKIDKKHATLTNLGQEFMHALGMYHSLMREFPGQSQYMYNVPKTVPVPFPYTPGPSAVPNQNVLNGPGPQQTFPSSVTTIHFPPGAIQTVAGPMPDLGRSGPSSGHSRAGGSPVVVQSPTTQTDGSHLPGPPLMMGPNMSQISHPIPNIQYARLPANAATVPLDGVYRPSVDSGMHIPYTSASANQSAYGQPELHPDVRPQQLL